LRPSASGATAWQLPLEIDANIASTFPARGAGIREQLSAGNPYRRRRAYRNAADPAFLFQSSIMSSAAVSLGTLNTEAGLEINVVIPTFTSEGFCANPATSFWVGGCRSRLTS
jgi:hypothetical protein